MSGRQNSCLHLVHALDTFSRDIMRNLQWFIGIQDTSGADMIWTCCVICLAHLAALCHRMSQTDPACSVSMNALCDLTLAKLGNLSLEIYIEKYSRFDVLTGVRVSTICSPKRGDTLTKSLYGIRCL